MAKDHRKVLITLFIMFYTELRAEDFVRPSPKIKVLSQYVLQEHSGPYCHQVDVGRVTCDFKDTNKVSNIEFLSFI